MVSYFPVRKACVILPRLNSEAVVAGFFSCTCIMCDKYNMYLFFGVTIKKMNCLCEEH